MFASNTDIHGKRPSGPTLVIPCDMLIDPIISGPKHDDNMQWLSRKNPKYDIFHVTFVRALPPLLTHWGRVTHICVSKLTTIGSDNGLSPVRRQAIIWTNAGIVLIRTLGTNFSEMLSEIHTFLFKTIHFWIVVWKKAAILSRPQCVRMRFWCRYVFVVVRYQSIYSYILSLNDGKHSFQK